MGAGLGGTLQSCLVNRARLQEQEFLLELVARAGIAFPGPGYARHASPGTKLPVLVQNSPSALPA